VAVEVGVLPARYSGARLIGHGGMGDIYLAVDRELGRHVAIKVLDERFADDEHLRRRFRREALAAARLSGHPHVVTIHDIGEWGGRPFIVMEYLPGGTVAERAGSGLVRPTEAMQWLSQVAEALDAAHELGVVHRDVKPANLLFDARGKIVVGDFGIARVAGETTGVTAAGTVLGTAGYLAPEQALGEPATEASDRYALAVVAYELLTGGRPFARSSTTAEAAAHLHESVPRASVRGVGLPRRIDDVFERALAKDPADRYPSAASFVAELREALESAPVTRARPRGGVVAVAEPAEPAVTRRRRAFWPPLVGAGLALAVVGGAAAALLVTGGKTSSATTIPRPQEVTVTKEVRKTTPGDTVTETVVTTVAAAPAPVATPPATANAVSIEEAVALTDESTYALRRGDWMEAAQLARRAYAPLRGSYSDDFRYEAYVNYDLGRALAELGRCRQAFRYLDRSEQLQGSRGEIDAARASCGA
jgi:eukaryotic-like serine/threonine-protein kinase